MGTTAARLARGGAGGDHAQSGWSDQDAPPGARRRPRRPRPCSRMRTTAAPPSAAVQQRGVCLPPLAARCPRHRWGPTCEVLAAGGRPERFHGWCVHNDSSPWFCDKPLCTGQPCHPQAHGRRPRASGGRRRRPAGAAAVACAAPAAAASATHRRRGVQRARALLVHLGLHGRGECDTGWCRCREPTTGSTAPSAARAGRAAEALATTCASPRARPRPCCPDPARSPPRPAAIPPRLAVTSP